MKEPKDQHPLWILKLPTRRWELQERGSEAGVGSEDMNRIEEGKAGDITGSAICFKDTGCSFPFQEKIREKWSGNDNKKQRRVLTCIQTVYPGCERNK